MHVNAANLHHIYTHTVLPLQLSFPLTEAEWANLRAALRVVEYESEQTRDRVVDRRSEFRK